VVTYDAVIDVANQDLKLKPGMTANISFVYAQRDGVLKVPNAALRFRPTPEMLAPKDSHTGDAMAATRKPPAPAEAKSEGGSDKRAVWVLRGELPVRVPIRVGVSDGSVSEVVEGELNEGDAVITDASGGGKAGGPPGGAQPFRRGF
jgi:HlyD family secretion protein